MPKVGLERVTVNELNQTKFDSDDLFLILIKEKCVMRIQQEYYQKITITASPLIFFNLRIVTDTHPY